MNELYDCHKYLKISMDTLWNMRVRDRRFMIARHNRDSEEQSHKNDGVRTTTDIDRYTDLTLENQKNQSRR